jgi:hypothetical protein
MLDIDLTTERIESKDALILAREFYIYKAECRVT